MDDEASTKYQREIDEQLWSVVRAAVARNDATLLATTYHADAVLVAQQATTPVALQMHAWSDHMDKLKAERRSASVAFRFRSRWADATTAFECGLFRYTEATAEGGDEVRVVPPKIVGFEALLVKKSNRWKMVMERQLEAADELAWDEWQR